ncbi:hypothetical protein ACU686_37045 [Yinghuangia aomiensis]
MEVVYDLDVQAAESAATLGLPVARAATTGADPRFAAAVRDLVLERAAALRGESPDRRALGPLGPSHDVCPLGCCPDPRGRGAGLRGAALEAVPPLSSQSRRRPGRRGPERRPVRPAARASGAADRMAG